MREETILIVICYLINWITLLGVISFSAKKKQTIIIHLSIQITYSFLWWYQLKYNSTGGTAIVAWLFWMISIGLHWLSYLIHFGFIFRKRPKKNN